MIDLIKKWTDADYTHFSSVNVYFGAVLKLNLSGEWVRSTDVLAQTVLLDSSHLGITIIARDKES